MPNVEVAMVRSLHEGAWEKLKDALARGIASDLARRNIVGDTQDKITDVKTAFSSWDNCMAADFCKWPVIAVIIVGGLIIFSVLWCIGRCLCCGVSCCCGCLKCLKCCGNCCGCFDAPGDRKHKYLDEPWAAPNHGYRAQEPMHFPPQTTGTSPPQYAEFDTSRKGGEDSLPAMPSWEGAGSRKVEVHTDAVELEPMKRSPPPTEQNVPLVAAALAPARNSPSPMGNRSNPYGPSPLRSNGYMQAPSQSRDPYGPPSPVSTYHNNADGYGLDQPYDAVAAGNMGPGASVGAGAAMIAGRNSPARNHNPYGGPQNQDYMNMPPENDFQARRTPGQGSMGQGPSGYGMRRQGTGEGPGPVPGALRRMDTGESMHGMGGQNPYGMDPRARNSPGPRRTPGQGSSPYGPPSRQSPGPQQPYGGYAAPPSQGRSDYDQPRPSYDAPMNRAYSPGPERPVPGYEAPTGRTYSPGPERQNPYDSPRPLARPSGTERAYTRSPPQSPITNNSGFDFTSGFSRPSTANGPASPAKQEAYPGYRPYQP